jgi:hypothetical protein
MAPFADFHNNSLLVYSLNFGAIMLIPKKEIDLKMFGLKINFNKSEISYYGSAKACET